MNIYAKLVIVQNSFDVEQGWRLQLGGGGSVRQVRLSYLFYPCFCNEGTTFEKVLGEAKWLDLSSFSVCISLKI